MCPLETQPWRENRNVHEMSLLHFRTWLSGCHGFLSVDRLLLELQTHPLTPSVPPSLLCLLTTRLRALPHSFPLRGPPPPPPPCLHCCGPLPASPAGLVTSWPFTCTPFLCFPRNRLSTALSKASVRPRPCPTQEPLLAPYCHQNKVPWSLMFLLNPATSYLSRRNTHHFPDTNHRVQVKQVKR